MIFCKQLLYTTSAIVLMCLCSCQPDDDTPFAEENVPQPASFTCKATVNGNGWEGKQNLSELIKNSSTTPSKQMRISVNSIDLKLLNITLEDGSTGVAGDGIAVKTYRLSATGTSDAAFVYSNNNTGATYVGAYGTITISKSDAANKKISGTFSCTLAQNAGDTIRITNGIINDLPYDITEQ